MNLEKLTSAIYNNIVSGLPGADVNGRFTLEQIEDSVIAERQAIIKEYAMKNLIPKKDLMLSINCLIVDCKSIERCCVAGSNGENIRHVEIPQILNDFGGEGVDFLGSTDRQLTFKVYTDYGWKNHKFKKRGAHLPYAWIDTTPNANNMYDVFIFNAPFVTNATISAIFKDPRQLRDFDCCGVEVDNIGYIDRELEKRVTESYIRYYRQMATALTPNDQSITT